LPGDAGCGRGDLRATLAVRWGDRHYPGFKHVDQRGRSVANEYWLFHVGTNVYECRRKSDTAPNCIGAVLMCGHQNTCRNASDLPDFLHDFVHWSVVNI